MQFSEWLKKEESLYLEIANAGKLIGLIASWANGELARTGREDIEEIKQIAQKIGSSPTPEYADPTLVEDLYNKLEKVQDEYIQISGGNAGAGFLQKLKMLFRGLGDKFGTLSPPAA